MSVIKHSAQRVAVFIDTQNLYHSAKNLYGKYVNFGNIIKEAVGERHLIRALAYVISTEDRTEQAFFEALAKVGIETKTKDIQIFIGGAKKADWDVGIAVDAITMAPKLDAVILITGDGDFVPLVQYLRIHSGLQVEAMSFRKSTSSKLVEAVDHFTDLAEQPRKFLLGSSNRRSTKKRTNPKTKKGSK